MNINSTQKKGSKIQEHMKKRQHQDQENKKQEWEEMTWFVRNTKSDDEVMRRGKGTITQTGRLKMLSHKHRQKDSTLCFLLGFAARGQEEVTGRH